ncbi:MAG: NAD(P)/FAD-dependent oxidoreductase [Clostridiales bacterium]|nr:NAD(P)/FAD-dependent oxidoreductase [Clostridiales bacterium]
MGKTILVAGAGHGGIAAAAELAKKGFDVTVIEKKQRSELGYDWTDIFDPNSLNVAGIPHPAQDKFEYKQNMTFFSPSRSVGLTQDVPKNDLEIKMERRDIYDHLINHAEKCGVKFIYGREALKPLILGNRVVGLYTSDGDMYADLVIDAAGAHSAVRSNMPEESLVENEVGSFEQFYVYRAFYNREGDFTPEHPFQVFLLYGGETQIVWLASEGEYTDVLIGRFEPFGQDEIDEVLSSIRETNPNLGTKVLRGGSHVIIPVRQPLSVMVYNGYAAIGDSAFMTVPLIGSGIANSLRAARMLVNTILSDDSGCYNAKTLWPYQQSYFKALGSGYAAMAVLKLFLLTLEPSELNFIFDKGILTAKEFTIGAGTVSLRSMLSMSLGDMIERAKVLCTDKILLTKIIKLGSRIAAAAAITAMLPKTYNEALLKKWASTYTSFYKKLEDSER